MVRRGWWAGTVGALVVALGLLTPAAQQLPRPSYETGVSLVIVDVTVLSRDGEPVTDLAASDFTLLVDGLPRPIVSHRLIRAAQPSAVPVPPPSRPTGQALATTETSQRFILVVDRDHIPVGEGQQMLAAGTRFVDGLPPNDRVALWVLSEPATTLRFNEEREALTRRLRQSVGTYRPPLARYVIARDEAIRIDDGDGTMLGTVVERECYKMPASCPAEVQAEATQLARDARERAARSLTQIEVLVKALGSVPGPKHLVLITGGPVQTREAIGDLQAIGRLSASSRVTIHALQVADTLLDMNTLRPQPMRVDQSQSAAISLASVTGGLAMTPASGDVGFQQLARELSAHYELTFEPGPDDRDGKEHRIEVRVADRGWGLTVRARREFRIDPTLAVPSASPAPPLASPMAPRERREPPEEEAPTEPAAAPGGPGILGPTDIPSLTTNLASYAERFEQEFSAVVAEERYVQVIHPWRGNPKGPEHEPSLAWQDNEHTQPAKGAPVISRRQLLSDVLLVQLATGQWLGYRDVAVVDGRPVRNRAERVSALFLGRSASREDQLRTVAEESSRYNLGNFRRTMNLPTLALGFMRTRDQWRFKFKRLKDETIDGRLARVLSYTENALPTLIGTPRGGNIPIQGRIWIDAVSGQVLRTELRFDAGNQRRVYVRTDFGSSERTAVPVPRRMWEWYEGVDQEGRIGGDKTVVQCLAMYDNFRRFQVTTGEAVK